MRKLHGGCEERRLFHLRPLPQIMPALFPLDLIFSTFLLSKSLAQPGHAYAALVPEVVFLAWGGMVRCRLQVDTCSVLVPIAVGLDLLTYLLLKAVGYSPSLTGFD